MLCIVFVVGKMWNKKDPTEISKNGWTTRIIAKIAILTAVAAAGGFITIPGPATSIRLDSAAGYFATLMFGWEVGVIVAVFGTFFANLMSGFSGWAPLVPYYMVNMALAVLLFGYASKKCGKITGIVVGTIINTICLLPWYLMLGIGIILPIVIPQMLGSFVNIFLAFVAYTAITKAKEKRKMDEIDEIIDEEKN